MFTAAIWVIDIYRYLAITKERNSKNRTIILFEGIGISIIVLK